MMFRVSPKLTQDYAQALRGQFAEELVTWWSQRFPWFTDALERQAQGGHRLGRQAVREQALATGLHAINESEACGFELQNQIMAYSVGYLCLGSRFHENVLFTNLMARCYWHDGVDASVKLTRIVEHVDMFMWDNILTAERGCFHGLPTVEVMQALQGEPMASLGAVVEQHAWHRLAAIDVDRLQDFGAGVAAELNGLGVPPQQHLVGALLGVFLGRHYLTSPAYTAIARLLRDGDVSRILEVLRG